MGLTDRLIPDRFKSNPFEDIDREELREEKHRLEREEKKKIKKLKDLESKKEKLFQKGYDVSDAERRQIANKITQLDRRSKQLNKHLKRLSKQIRIVDNLKFIDEKRKMLEKEGLISELSNLDKKNLEEFLGKVDVEQSVRGDKEDELLDEMEAEFGLDEKVEEEEEVEELMDTWKEGDMAEADKELEKWEKKRKEDEEDFDLESV